MSEPTVYQENGEWRVAIDDEVYRVLTWRPPQLVLARTNAGSSADDETSADAIRTVFVTRTSEQLFVGANGHVASIETKRRRGAGAAAAVEGHDDLTSPMPGKVLEVLVAEGDTVEAGQRLMILEAMKMESPVRAPHVSVVTKLHVSVGDSIAAGDILIELDAPKADE